MAASRLGAPRSESRYCQRSDCFRPDCADCVPPQSGDGQRPDTDAGRGGRHAFGLLCRLAECVFRVTCREGCLRETSTLITFWECAALRQFMPLKVVRFRELRRWKSKELARRLPRRDRQRGSLAQYESI